MKTVALNRELKTPPGTHAAGPTPDLIALNFLLGVAIGDLPRALRRPVRRAVAGGASDLSEVVQKAVRHPDNVKALRSDGLALVVERDPDTEDRRPLSAVAFGRELDTLPCSPCSSCAPPPETW